MTSDGAQVVADVTPGASPPLLPQPTEETLHGRWHWLGGFTRITSSGNFIPEIDGLRFIAVATVLIYHIIIWIVGPLGLHITTWQMGLRRGVELFFVISGFILAVPFAAHYLRDEKPVKLKSYFLRRLTRLEPPYIVYMILLATMKAALIPEYFPKIYLNMLIGIVYLHNILVGQHNPVSAVVWSLEVEVQFYVLMPLLAMVFLIRRGWMRRGLIIFAGAVLMMLQPMMHPPIIVPGYYAPNDSHFLNYAQYFLAGILLADIWVCEWNNTPPLMKEKWTAFGDVTSLLVCAGLAFVTTRGQVMEYYPETLEHYTLPILLFLLCWCAFKSNFLRRFLRLPLVTIIGGMCYSIYLIHNPVIQFGGAPLVRFLPKNYYGAMLVGFLMMVPLVLGISAIYFKLIERPCMRRDWWQRFRRGIAGLIFVEEDEPKARSS